MTSLKFIVVLCRIRPFPTLISKIKRIGSEQPNLKMNFEKHPVLNYDLSMSHHAKNESLKSSKRPSVIFTCSKPEKSTPDASTESEEIDLSEDEVELTNEMLLDLKNSFKRIKESFDNDDVVDQRSPDRQKTEVVPLDETIVVNSTDSAIINGVSNDNVTNDDVTKEDATKEDVTKVDVNKSSTQNAQSETKRTKTSQKRPSKSNIQFQVPKKLQVKTQINAHW